jgi:hypothetical protein
MNIKYKFLLDVFKIFDFCRYNWIPSNWGIFHLGSNSVTYMNNPKSIVEMEYVTDLTKSSNSIG